MALTKHRREEDLFLNNSYNNYSESSGEDSSDEEVSGIVNIKPFKKLPKKTVNFIHNDLRGVHNRGPNNGGEKVCQGCGKFSSKNLYLALNFECGDDEDHPLLSKHCAMEALICCVHPTAKKVEDYDEEILIVDE